MCLYHINYIIVPKPNIIFIHIILIWRGSGTPIYSQDDQCSITILMLKELCQTSYPPCHCDVHRLVSTCQCMFQMKKKLKIAIFIPYFWRQISFGWWLACMITRGGPDPTQNPTTYLRAHHPNERKTTRGTLTRCPPSSPPNN